MPVGADRRDWWADPTAKTDQGVPQRAVTVMANSTTDNRLPGTSVLIAEDDPATRALLSMWLKRAGYEVATAADGQQAWKMIRADCPDIVLADWFMPHMDGLTLCRSVRGEHPRHQVYLLVTTARDEPDAMTQVMAAGADDFVTKPLDRHELMARIYHAEGALQHLRDQAQLADTDPLTNLLNRRTFCQACEREILRSERYDYPLSCILLDVDFFKQVNDTHGHAIGDQALCTIAEALQAVARATDSVGRLGGDEFCVLLPRRVKKTRSRSAHRIQETIAERRIPLEQSELELHVTLGVAGWKKDVATPTALIDLADQALLAAKQSGRRCVMAFTQLHSDVSESANDQYRGVLAKVVASEVMSPLVMSMRQDQPIRDAATLFFGLRIRSAPVLDGDSQLVGIVDETHLLNAAISHDQWATPIHEVMQTNVVCYEEETPIVEIWDFLRRVTIHNVVIVSDGTPVGVLSRATLLRWLSNWSSAAFRNKTGGETDDDWQQRLQTTVSSITASVGDLEADLTRTGGDPMHCILSAATRLQESAQDLLALCQPHDRFEPGV